jgi:glycosyltransferase involved in cell wall biosynthesis
MKVLHFVLGKGSKERANGVNQVVAGLAKYSVSAGAKVRVIGKTHSVAAAGETIARDGFDVEAFPSWGRALRGRLAEAIDWANVVHLHGGYSPWNILVGRMCEVRRTPYVVTLHNVLSPELTLAHGHFRKAAFHWLLQRKHLERAAALHVLTEEEATDALQRLDPAQIFCIPNGIDPGDFAAQTPRPPCADGLTIGHLGRLAPEKNLEALCTAVNALRGEWAVRLKLAGPPSRYGEQLRSRFGDTWVELTGPVYGESKTAFMRSVDLLVVPSLSEGFAVVAAEALAMGTPLLITRTSKMAHYFDRQAFFMCEPTAFGMERGLRRALAEQGKWNLMAANGRRLVDECLNWRVIASQMLASYEALDRAS